jgi:6-pyruvoyltetrahydropterin/6-carboxytetrahydropterin synthase
MYEVSVEAGFSAAHSLRNYGGECEKLHGHNWKVRVTVSSAKPDDAGLVMDFKKLRDIMNGLLGRFDHVNLNELPEFKDENPTTENIARIVFERLEEAVSGESVQVKEVRVGETEGSWASYRK